MAANRIPEAVRQLIADSIDSIAELEAILLLRRERDRFWSVEEAGRRLYVSEVVAGHVLSVLTERGFFDVFPADDDTKFAGTWGNYPWFDDGIVAVSSTEEGLFILKNRSMSATTSAN